jgi:TfoX/Sxy family transcriptional regulator of competence genes
MPFRRAFFNLKLRLTGGVPAWFPAAPLTPSSIYTILSLWEDVNACVGLHRREAAMPYSMKLEENIDSAVKRWKNMEKKKMFGGVCYLFNDNIAFGIYKDFLIVRVDQGLSEKSLRNKNVKPFDITGRPMSGWIMVNEAGWTGKAALAKWIDAGKRFALSLPEKKTKARKTKTLKEYKA